MECSYQKIQELRKSGFTSLYNLQTKPIFLTTTNFVKTKRYPTATNFHVRLNNVIHHINKHNLQPPEIMQFSTHDFPNHSTHIQPTPPKPQSPTTQVQPTTPKPQSPTPMPPSQSINSKYPHDELQRLATALNTNFTVAELIIDNRETHLSHQLMNIEIIYHIYGTLFEWSKEHIQLVLENCIDGYRTLTPPLPQLLQDQCPNLYQKFEKVIDYIDENDITDEQLLQLQITNIPQIWLSCLCTYFSLKYIVLQS